MRISCGLIAVAAFGPAIAAAPPLLGPLNLDIIAAGDAVTETVPAGSIAGVGRQGGDWTLSADVSPAFGGQHDVFSLRAEGGAERVALAIDDGGITVRTPSCPALRGGAPLRQGGWTSLLVTARGRRLEVFENGIRVAAGPDCGGPDAPATLVIAPRGSGSPFAGRIADLRLGAGAVDSAIARQLAAIRPDPALIRFTTNSPTWPVQTRQQIGQVTPQPAETLPVSRAPFSRPVAKPVADLPVLRAKGEGRWDVGGWMLAAAPDVSGDGATFSHGGPVAGRWLHATVPGTVLTTLVDRGIYPDPAFGLNNMAIPESLAHEDWWYRTTFDLPEGAPGGHWFLNFGGINYAGEIWINGQRIGSTRGAFIRGGFDITDVAAAGGSVTVAVKVSPPPHPGIAEEESLTAGAGENGGMLVLDGPTFVASEGWDWIPSIRDRETGLWQGVTLGETGSVALGDPQVVTRLPRPDLSEADVSIDVPVRNLETHAVVAEIAASFDDVRVSQSVTLAPGQTRAVRFAPAAYRQLAVRNPRLWWPNGYGAPTLHDLTISASAGGAQSDCRHLRFGMREVSYDLSLVDQDGRLRRVTVDPSAAPGTEIVDNSHEGIREVPGGWAASLAPGADRSPAVRPLADAPGLSPYLVIRVNGVRIAARGGNWGMDDLLKRVGRDRLEPFFRLHRDAHLNIIRNWVGQNTEETFYALADEYGLMVLNDFWESTQNYNQQADDPALFLRNAADVVRRFRNHPSIIAWIGRNEGVPQPVLNRGLERLIVQDDGTRLYLASSNHINLAGSGPYDWRDPAGYFTEHAPGFAVEVGTPSFPTLESWRRSMPAADLWPISDDWAYHDWHQDRGGAVKSYMAAMDERFGAPSSLADFARKAQMLQYDSYRAIFEGFNAGLWTRTSGRMLWMTQPAWPSSAWNIFSSDYDTQASYYAVKSASEPVHVQMNLPDHAVVLVNNTGAALPDVSVRMTVVDLAGRTIADRTVTVAAAAAAVTPVALPVAAALEKAPAAVVRLQAMSAAGALLSRNVYWVGRTPAELKAMTTMPHVPLAATATSSRSAEGERIGISLYNRSSSPAIEAKLTLFDAHDRQVLPAYYSDNYVSLLPGETRTIAIDLPRTAAPGPYRLKLRGWNVDPSTITIGGQPGRTNAPPRRLTDLQGDRH